MDNTKCRRGCRTTGNLIHCWWECKTVQPLWRAAWQFPMKLHIHLPYDPVINPTPRYVPERNENTGPHQVLYTNAHSSFIHKNPKLATTQKISTGTKEQTMVHPRNGILLTNTKERTIDTGHNLDPSRRHYIKKPVSKGYLLYDSIYMTFSKRQSYKNG